MSFRHSSLNAHSGGNIIDVSYNHLPNSRYSGSGHVVHQHHVQPRYSSPIGHLGGNIIDVSYNHLPNSRYSGGGHVVGQHHVQPRATSVTRVPSHLVGGGHLVSYSGGYYGNYRNRPAVLDEYGIQDHVHPQNYHGDVVAVDYNVRECTWHPPVTPVPYYKYAPPPRPPAPPRYEPPQPPPEPEPTPQPLPDPNLRPWFGAEIKWLDDEHGGHDTVAVVHQVIPGSPADNAGLRPEDQLEYWEGTKIDGLSVWKSLVTKIQIGDVINMGIHRGHQDQRIMVRITGTNRSKGGKKVVSSANMAHTDN